MSHTVSVDIMCTISHTFSSTIAIGSVTAQVDADSFANAYATSLRDIHEGNAPVRTRRELIEAALTDTMTYDNIYGACKFLGVTDDGFEVINAMRPWLSSEQIKMLEDAPSCAESVFA